jgi:hypothetical protein
MPIVDIFHRQKFSPKAIFIFGGAQLAHLHFFQFMQQAFMVQMEPHPVH